MNVGLILSRRAGEKIHLFLDDTETVVEVLSVAHNPVSTTIRFTPKGGVEWYDEAKPDEALRLLYLNQDDQLMISGRGPAVSGEGQRILLTFVGTNRSQARIGFNSKHNLVIFRGELTEALDHHRKLRGIA
jgi:sRNA-binding carbon storage regulator CsrA